MARPVSAVPVPLVIVEPTESGVRRPARGAPAPAFSIHDASGKVIATEVHFEMALATQRDLDAGEEVRRISDGALLATKYRLKGEAFYSSIWRMQNEPPWESR